MNDNISPRQPSCVESLVTLADSLSELLEGQEDLGAPGERIEAAVETCVSAIVAALTELAAGEQHARARRSLECLLIEGKSLALIEALPDLDTPKHKAELSKMAAQVKSYGLPLLEAKFRKGLLLTKTWRDAGAIGTQQIFAEAFRIWSADPDLARRALLATSAQAPVLEGLFLYLDRKNGPRKVDERLLLCLAEIVADQVRRHGEDLVASLHWNTAQLRVMCAAGLARAHAIDLVERRRSAAGREDLLPQNDLSSAHGWMAFLASLPPVHDQIAALLARR